MKLKSIILMIAILSTLSLSETKYPFWGIIGYSSDINGEQGGVVGIRYGQQSKDWRTSFTLESSFKDHQLFTIQIDRTLLHSLTTSKLRIYGGIIGGAVAQDKNDGSGDKNLGYSYGLSIGFMFYLSDNIDLDLGYRYMRVTDLDNIDKISSVSFSIHYFF
jgi:opacity protein-like surface antigen